MIDLDLFFDISRDVAMATNFVENGKLRHLSLWRFETEWYITTSVCALTAKMMPLYNVKIS